MMRLAVVCQGSSLYLEAVQQQPRSNVEIVYDSR
jgi:hypothetical protein